MITILILSILSLIISVFKMRNNPYICNMVIGMAMGYNKTQRRVVMAQMQHETADFQSNVYKQAKNVSGMRLAAKRVQRGVIGEYNGYAKFKSVWWSVLDLYAWLKANGIPKTESPVLYCSALKARNYYSASLEGYTKAVVTFFNQPVHFTVVPIILISLCGVAIGTIIWVICKWIKSKVTGRRYA